MDGRTMQQGVAEVGGGSGALREVPADDRATDQK